MVRADGMRFIPALSSKHTCVGVLSLCPPHLFLFFLPIIPSHLSLSCHPSEIDFCFVSSFSLQPFHHSLFPDFHLCLTCTGDHFTPPLCLFCLSCRSLTPSQMKPNNSVLTREHPVQPIHTTTTCTIPTNPQLISADRGR